LHIYEYWCPSSTLSTCFYPRLGLIAGPDYLQKLSHDGGSLWVAGAAMTGIGSVCPRLLMMPGGALLLSGGNRRGYSAVPTASAKSYDNQLWVNCVSADAFSILPLPAIDLS
jgi:hypothetical protein